MLQRIFALLLLPTAAFGQNFSGSQGPISDVTTTEFTVTVSGLPALIDEVNFGLETVCLNLNHTWDSDLTISLLAPDGNSVVLVASEGSDGDDFQNTCLDGVSTNLFSTATPPFTGTFRPSDPLGNLNNGQDPNGTWILRITDCCGGDDGFLNSWSITFGNSPAVGFHFTSSNLPIVVIDTYGAEIPDDPKIDAHMGIIYNGPGVVNNVWDPLNAYNNKIGIEQRGSSSGGFPQKSYGFETRDVNGTEHDTTLLGMPEEHDWILYAPYNDKTCIRNILTYQLANETGHYAPRTKLCELVLNGNYLGIYVLMEKIKRDDSRVNISKLNPTEIAGDDLTGGYIIKLDRNDGPGSYWNSNFPASTGWNPEVVLVYPKPENVVPQQMDYIHAFVDSFELALATKPFSDTVNGYRHFIDVHYFIDYFLITEASKNVDGYRLSAFLYKDKNSKGGKLVAGPAWDYNLAWWNADYCGGDDFTGWQFLQNDICGGWEHDIPFWWEKLMEDPYFVDELKCRWNELKSTVFNMTHISALTDSLVTEIGNAADRHFYKWPVLGIYLWPNPSPLPTDFAGEIQAMKDWTDQRLAWLDENMPGTCHLGLKEIDITTTVSPNPFTSSFVLEAKDLSGSVDFTITDVSGKEIVRGSGEFINGRLEVTGLESLTPGVYMLNTIGDSMRTIRIMKQ